MIRRPPRSTLFPSTPLSRSLPWVMSKFMAMGLSLEEVVQRATIEPAKLIGRVPGLGTLAVGAPADVAIFDYSDGPAVELDRKSTRLNSSHGYISYAVFCLKK